MCQYELYLWIEVFDFDLFFLFNFVFEEEFDDFNLFFDETGLNACLYSAPYVTSSKNLNESLLMSNTYMTTCSKGRVAALSKLLIQKAASRPFSY